MEKKIKKLFSAFFLCAALIITFAGKQVHAAAKVPSCPKTLTVYCYRNDLGGDRPVKIYGYNDFETDSFRPNNITEGAVVSNVKTSNSKISVGPSNVYTEVGFSIKDWRAGVKDGEKAKITFTVKQNGKKYNLSTTLIFKKAKSPFSSLKIGNKEYASAFNGTHKQGIDFPKSKLKFSYKLKSSYEAKSVWVVFNDGTDKELKSGMTVNWKNVDYIQIAYVDKKLGYYQYRHLYSWDFVN